MNKFLVAILAAGAAAAVGYVAAQALKDKGSDSDYDDDDYDDFDNFDTDESIDFEISEEAADEIKEKALYWSIKIATVEEIESINILQSAMLAMKRAVEDLPVKPDICLIDGNKTPELDTVATAIVGGDAKSQSIAAASILAKVARDRYMLEMAEQYPDYQFEKHKGYGTKLHYEMIDKFGASPIHRQSFLKKYYAKLSEKQQENR